MSKKFVKQRWRILQKIRFVAETWPLKGADLGRYLREKGLHRHDIQTWKEQMAMGISGEKPVYLEERKWYKSKIEKLERELFEARMIIDLQKKILKSKSGEGPRQESKLKEKLSNLLKKP